MQQTLELCRQDKVQQRDSHNEHDEQLLDHASRLKVVAVQGAFDSILTREQRFGQGVLDDFAEGLVIGAPDVDGYIFTFAAGTQSFVVGSTLHLNQIGERYVDAIAGFHGAVEHLFNFATVLSDDDGDALTSAGDLIDLAVANQLAHTVIELVVRHLVVGQLHRVGR